MIYEKNGALSLQKEQVIDTHKSLSICLSSQRKLNQRLHIFSVINQIDGQVIHTLAKELLELRMDNLRIGRSNPSRI